MSKDLKALEQENEMGKVIETEFKIFQKKHPNFFCPYVLLNFKTHKLGGESNIYDEICPIMKFEFRCLYYDTPETKDYKLCPYYQK